MAYCIFISIHPTYIQHGTLEIPEEGALIKVIGNSRGDGVWIRTDLERGKDIILPGNSRGQRLIGLEIQKGTYCRDSIVPGNSKRGGILGQIPGEEGGGVV